MKALVWLDGRIVAHRRATIPIDDRGFLFGDAVFETLRLDGGRPRALAAHLGRLRRTLRAWHFPKLPWDLGAAIDELVRAARIEDAALRITVTRGSGATLVPPPDLVSRVLLVPRPIPPELPLLRERGVAVVRLPFGRGPGRLTAGYKTTDYLTAVAGRMAAERAGAFEALYVEPGGLISEGTTSNVFVVRRGRLCTPPLSAGCLPGVTRAFVMARARSMGLEVEEAPLPATRLARCDEAFLTGSVIEILPVTQIDGAPLGDGRPGPVTRRLATLCAAAWRRERVRR